MDRDKGKKTKKSKKASKKGRRGGKKGKKKKEKDLTPDRTLESLFEELVTNGIIRKYPETPLTSFKGERAFTAAELRFLGKDPSPTLGDIRQVSSFVEIKNVFISNDNFILGAAVVYLIVYWAIT